MLTNILTQDFSDLAAITKAVVNPQKKGIDVLADFYTQTISANETKLVSDYSERLFSNKTPHTPDPRLYMRQNLQSLVQDSYALGISDAIDSLKDVQFSYKKTTAEFVIGTPDERLQNNIARLQRDIEASANIVRQPKTLAGYTKTLQTLQRQAETLNNTEATQTLNQLSANLQQLKTNNAVRAATGLIDKQLQRGQKPYDRLMEKLEQNKEDFEESRREDPIYDDNGRIIKQRPTTVGDYTTPQDYLVKRAIEEKLKYLQNRKDALQQVPPVVLDEDKDFFKWYNQKRIVPIANRYQIGLEDRNTEAKKIVADYTEKINQGTVSAAARSDYQQKVINKLLTIEDKVEAGVDTEEKKANKFNGSAEQKFKRDQTPIKRVQRVVATELAIAYNIGRLKTYLKAGIQYVTISTSMYSANPCNYCIDTERKSQDQPIKISSLLKNAYKNDGFENKTAYEAGQDVPIEQRYLVAHPYCFCMYMPHPKQDDTEKESAGMYADPNSWKFILGAGLGVSLAYLAFALTTGKKINIPTTIPVNLPVRAKQGIPDIVSDTQPVAIPVRAIPAGIQPALPDLLRSITNLSTDKQVDYAEIILNPLLTQNQQLDAIIRLAERDGLTDNPNNIIDAVVQEVAKNKGVRRLLIQTSKQKIAATYDRNIEPLQTRIQELQQKLTTASTKADTNSLTNTVRNINKTFVVQQLRSIRSTKDLILESLTKTRDKTKLKDIEYREELLATLDTLSSMESALEQQKGVLSQIQERVQNIAAAIPTKKVLKTYRDLQIKQEIARALADIDSVNVASATERYNDLLALLIELPAGESNKYLKQVQNLKTKIQKASITELKHRRLAFFNRKHQ